MTLEIGLVLGILAAVLVLLVTEKVRPDVLALLVLGALALTGLVSYKEALAGFSNPAVVTVWAMFMISEALTRTGVAGIVGRAVQGLIGEGEARAAFVIMVTAGVLSAFMNNIGVAALMLPVVMGIAKNTGRSPSRLLMPLAYGSLLGGLTTLVGTPPNLLASESLREITGSSFGMFDFSPVGLPVLVGGSLFVAIVGVRFLPRNEVGAGEMTDEKRLQRQYGLGERTMVLRVPAGTRLVGRTLRESRLGSAAEVSVFAILRGDRTEPLPEPDQVIEAEDRLVIGGRLDRFTELKRWQELEIVDEVADLDRHLSDDVRLVEFTIEAGSELVGCTVIEANFRSNIGGIVFGLRRGSQTWYEDLITVRFEPGDRLLLQARSAARDRLRTAEHGQLDETRSPAEWIAEFEMEDHLFVVRVPGDSALAGESVVESRLGSALRLAGLGILRENEAYRVADAGEVLRGGDRLVVRGSPEAFDALLALQELEVDREEDLNLDLLRSENVDLVEAVLSPHAGLAGRTLEDLSFRRKYGVHVLAVHSGGEAHWSGLRSRKLRLGDALLLMGPPDRLRVLEEDDDFVVLAPSTQAEIRTGKAGLATLVVFATVGSVLAGWLPIAIAGVIASAILILLGCLTMEEAYRAVEWRSIFLIAGMLPLGAAMQSSGAANWLAEWVLSVAGPFGPWGVVVGLYFVTSLATMIVPTAALMVILAPIAIKAAADMQVAPETFMMAVAMAASASFTSPVSHPANLLVMGPGGYRFKDYLIVGVPLTLVVFVIVMLTLPIFWPL